MSALPDPLEALEQVAFRQAASEAAARSIGAARAKLILGRDGKSVFFATLILRLKLEVDWKCPTMATDGRSLFYSPEFVNGLSPEELVGTLVHETMHLAMAHHCRRGDRDPTKWNIATDVSLNQILLDAGFILPSGRLVAGEGPYADLPTGRSAEEYYSLLPVPLEGSDGDPGRCGQVLDAGDGSPADAANQQAEWHAATALAEQTARTRGTLPSGLGRTVQGILHPPADWRSILREFVASNAKSNYSWSRPNRRFIAQGLYLPGLHSEKLEDVVISIDTSGSVGERELSLFESEINAVLSSYDTTVTVLFHDSCIQKVVEHCSTDGPLTLQPVGGGGTSHVCVFDWLKEARAQPACVLCLTDLYTDFPAEPGIPVLWAVVGGNKEIPPFGRVVEIAA